MNEDFQRALETFKTKIKSKDLQREVLAIHSNIEK